MGAPLRLGSRPFRALLRDPDDDLFHGFLSLFVSLATVVMVWVTGAPVDDMPPEICLLEPVRIAMIPTHVAPSPPVSVIESAPVPSPAAAAPVGLPPRVQQDESALLIALMATPAARHRGTTADPYTSSGTVGDQLDVALEACALRRVLCWRVPEELPPGEVVTPFVLSPG